MMITQEIPLRLSSCTEKMENWRVLLAEGHPVFRQEIVKTLAEMPGINLVAKVVNGWDVMFTSSQLKPDIILLDFSLPGLSGVEVTSLIRRGLPQIQVVILLDEENERDIKAVEQCGACAYLLKSRLAQEMPSLLGKLEQAKRGNDNSAEINS